MAMTLQRLYRFGLLLSLLVAAGCGGSGMGRFDVTVALDAAAFQKDLGGNIPSVEVNLVGVNATEYPLWQSKPMSKYWEPDDTLRKTAVQQGYALVLTFGQGKEPALFLPRYHPIWEVWKARGALHLFVLSNYPRVSTDQPGDADARRRILPLRKNRWRGYVWGNFPQGKRDISIQVTPAGVAVLTPPKPE